MVRSFRNFYCLVSMVGVVDFWGGRAGVFRAFLLKILFGNPMRGFGYDATDEQQPLCSLPSFAAERRKQERRRQCALLNGTAKPQNLSSGRHLLRCRRSPVTKTGFTPPPCICNPRAILRCFAVAAQPLRFRFASAVSLRRPHDLGAARPQDPPKRRSKATFPKNEHSTFS